MANLPGRGRWQLVVSVHQMAHVQHYDSKEAVMENAEKRVSRLEKEKAETKAAKKSIHERLGEKKQQSAAKKAEKAVDKAVKKDKGQKL